MGHADAKNCSELLRPDGVRVIHLRQGFPRDHLTYCLIDRTYWGWYPWAIFVEKRIRRLGPRDWLWSREYLKTPIEHACGACVDGFKRIMLEKLAEVEL